MLFESARYPSALALAILSIEESGKAFILRSLSLAHDGKELKEGWRKYRSHKDKNTHWIAVDMMLEGAKSLSDLSKVADPRSSNDLGSIEAGGAIYRLFGFCPLVFPRRSSR
ncbi:hypothetical protein GCM10011348_18840 [Marinobacterium nitratireducens]|uniref:Uncharacterized protein n=1 Tax=Marinobacterium nitratireducens TaxID=518897 RepID=A0A918DT33_9GAMM|nr:hypothetical protein GCM10011348_18840 [Marinobacterium nitratireducens]